MGQPSTALACSLHLMQVSADQLSWIVVGIAGRCGVEVRVGPQLQRQHAGGSADSQQPNQSAHLLSICSWLLLTASCLSLFLTSFAAW